MTFDGRTHPHKRQTMRRKKSRTSRFLLLLLFWYQVVYDFSQTKIVRMATNKYAHEKKKRRTNVLYARQIK